MDGARVVSAAARRPFAVDLPAAPLFKDGLDGKSLIPQVPLFEVLRKLDGVTVTDVLRQGFVERKVYRLLRLPPYLMFHMKRFTRNNWFMEKNPTVVTFPVKNLEMAPYVSAEGRAAMVAICAAT